MLIELLKTGEYKVGAFNTPSYQKYSLSFDLSNFTISVKFTTAPLSAFEGNTQNEKLHAKIALSNKMRVQFLVEVQQKHNIDLNIKDTNYFYPDISEDGRLIINTSGVIKLIDQLYSAHKEEIYAQALWFIKVLLLKDKQKITEAFTDVDCIEYDTEQNNWNYIYVSPELNNMPNLAETVTKAMSLGIAYLINVNSRDIQETHHRIKGVDYKAVTLKDDNYEKFTNIYDEIDEAEAKKQTEQKQVAPAPAAANNTNTSAVKVRRFPSKYHGKGAIDSSPKPKPTRPAPQPPLINSGTPAKAAATPSADTSIPQSLTSDAASTKISAIEKPPTESVVSSLNAPSPLPPPRSSSMPIDLNSVVDLQSAKNFLEEHIYKNNAIYTYKAIYLKMIKETFNKLSTQNGNVDQRDIITELCDLFDYIDEKQRKEKVNLRKNPWYDTLFRKQNTSNWITTVREIRNAAYERLIAIANEKFPGQPEQQIVYMKPFRDRKLFAEHLDNSIFNIFHNTKTVQKIDEQISVRTVKQC